MASEIIRVFKDLKNHTMPLSKEGKKLFTQMQYAALELGLHESPSAGFENELGIARTASEGVCTAAERLTKVLNELAALEKKLKALEARESALPSPAPPVALAADQKLSGKRALMPSDAENIAPMNEMKPGTQPNRSTSNPLQSTTKNGTSEIRRPDRLEQLSRKRALPTEGANDAGTCSKRSRTTPRTHSGRQQRCPRSLNPNM